MTRKMKGSLGQINSDSMRADIAGAVASLTESEPGVLN